MDRLSVLVLAVCCFGNALGYTSYHSELKKAQGWLLKERVNWGWGEETPRAMVALALSDTEQDLEYKLSIKELSLQLAAKLLTNKSAEKMLYVNALLATCQDPRNFYGIDLISDLEDAHLKEEPNNFALSLTLCNAGGKLDGRTLRNLAIRVMGENVFSPIVLESQSLALLALKCFHDKIDYNQADTLDRTTQQGLAKLLKMQDNDGGFGYLYTTAIATQVMMVYNTDSEFDEKIESALQYLLKKQNDSGSFQDIMGTYLVLPMLNKKTLLNIGNMSCNEEKKEARIDIGRQTRQITVSLKFDGIVISITIPVYKNNTIFDILSIAAQRDKSFQFEYTKYEAGTYVNSLAGKKNDMERGLYWSLTLNSKWLDRSKVTEISYKDNVATYIPDLHTYSITYSYKKLQN